MVKKLMIIGIVAMLLLSGCGDKVQADKKESPQKTETLSLVEIKTKNTKQCEADVSEFHVADGEYIAESGKKMPYALRGVMGVPKGSGTYPLILIMHGSHSNIDESLRYDTGFTYLVEYLAENGYLALSLDVSKPYIWKYGDGDEREKVIYLVEEHMKNLELANEGKGLNYPIDLKGKIDFDKIAMIGHSRGGDIIFPLACEMEKKKYPIEALMAIAPAASEDLESREWANSEVTIVVPEYDGDVSSLDGFNFDEMLEQKLDNPHGVTYVLGANHNYFNTNIDLNDATLARGEEELRDQITKEQQQEFLKNYTLDYLNAAIKGEVKDTMYDLSKAGPDTMYGVGVLTRLYDKNVTEIADIAKMDQYKEDGMTKEKVTDSWFYKEDKIPIDTITFGQEGNKVKNLLNFKWNTNKNQVVILPDQKDFSEYKALTLNLIPDSSDPIYKKETGVGFTIELKDGKGKSAKIKIPKTAHAVRITPGKMDVTEMEEMDYHFFTPMTPIGSIRIPLHLFKNIDRKNMKELTLYFDQEKEGSVYIESLYVQ